LWVENRRHTVLYVDDFKRGTNKDIGSKDIFEMGFRKVYDIGSPVEPVETVKNGIKDNSIFNGQRTQLASILCIFEIVDGSLASKKTFINIILI
jgi:hypothetical protein